MQQTHIASGYTPDELTVEAASMTNKLFCTFTTKDNLDNLLQEIQHKYDITYNKIFVLYSKEQDEYMCTYNVEPGTTSTFLENTILVHRKKESNTLYTINALNTLIKELNNEILDKSYRVNWKDFKNCILLTNGPKVKKINTKLYRIIDL